MMTRDELDKALIQLGLNVPEAERDDIRVATKFIEEIKISVRKSLVKIVKKPLEMKTVVKKAVVKKSIMSNQENSLQNNHTKLD